MAYKVAQVDNFAGGLNLRDKADVVRDSQAIDLLNVEFTDVGAIRQRDGYALHTAAAMTNRADSLSDFYQTSGTHQLLVGAGTRLEALDQAGAIVGSATTAVGGPWHFTRFGGPTLGEVAYAGNPHGDTLRKWNGTAWSVPTATVDGVAGRTMPEGYILAVTPNSHRLVNTGFNAAHTLGGPNNAASNASRVYFSEPAAPETWVTTNWVDLHPGDGEKITGAIAWRDQLIIFKETKFFVFGPESTDEDGLPVFDYYDVSTGVGLAVPHAITASKDGVYFMSRYGVYTTTGSEPKLLSELVEPFWLGNASGYFQSDTVNHAELDMARMAWHDERLYVALPTGIATVNNRVLVHDLQQGWWSLFDLPASALTTWRHSDQPELHFGLSSGANDIARVMAGETDDNGTAITSRWRSGFADYGSSAIKRIRETKLWGSGNITARFSKDFEQAPFSQAEVAMAGATDMWGDGTDPLETWGDGTDLSDVWGGAGQISPALVRKGIRGTVLSVQFENNPLTPTWSVHRMARHIAGQAAVSKVRVG